MPIPLVAEFKPQRCGAFCLILLTALCTFPTPSQVRADIEVISVSPERNALHVANNSTVKISLSSAVDPSSLNGKTLLVFGLWSGVAAGDVEVSDNGRVITFILKHSFSAGERVTVSVARSLSGLDGSSLGRGYVWQFWVASGRAGIAPVETERISVRRPGEKWIQTYGAYAGDRRDRGIRGRHERGRPARPCRWFV